MFQPLQNMSLWVVVRLQTALYQQNGQTLGEYALLISLVGVGATILGMIAFRAHLVTGYGSMTNCLNGGC